MFKRGSYSFRVRLPDSQLASLFVPPHDYLPQLPGDLSRASQTI